MNQRKNSPKVLAGTLLTPTGIYYNHLVFRSPDGALTIEPFSRETPSTSFIDLVAIVSNPTAELIDQIESLYQRHPAPETIYHFLQSAGVLSFSGILLSIKRQSIIIDI